MSFESHLKAIGPAVTHFFSALDEYYETPLPNIYDYVGEDGVVRMTKEENEIFLQQTIEYMDLDRARAIAAGAILQTAFKTIKLHSEHTVEPEPSLDLDIPKKHLAERFCIGRKVHGIPIGLIIYAGRIQYNHWEEGEPWNKIARSVLRKLYIVHLENPLFDLAYDLEFPAPKPLSHYVVRLELKWRSCNDFEKDMTNMLR